VSEIFNEVDEEVRREQLKKLWERYSILIVAAAILIVAGVAGWRGYQYWLTKQSAAAGSAFEDAVLLADQNKTAEAEAAFTKLGSEAPRGYRALARLRAAAETAKRDPAAAVKLYDAIAVDTSLDSGERDLATIRAVSLQLDSLSYDAAKQRLEPLTSAGRTFRHTAREVLAVSAWRNNDMTASRRWLDLIANDAETPATMRSRAEALQALLPPAAKS